MCVRRGRGASGHLNCILSLQCERHWAWLVLTQSVKLTRLPLLLLNRPCCSSLISSWRLQVTVCLCLYPWLYMMHSQVKAQYHKPVIRLPDTILCCFCTLLLLVHCMFSQELTTETISVQISCKMLLPAMWKVCINWECHRELAQCAALCSFQHLFSRPMWFNPSCSLPNIKLWETAPPSLKCCK